MPRQFNIISSKIQGLSSQKDVEIKNLIDNNPQIDIKCIQETKFIDNYVRTFPGFSSEFNFFYSGPNTPKIIYQGDYEVITVTVDNPSNDQGEVILEIQAIKIHTNGRPFCLVN
jgi:exonuclease III